MERFFEFIQNHPILFGTFVGLMIVYIWSETRRSGKKVSPQQLGLMMTNDNAMVIDLRDPKEFDAGHISGSENIPFSKLSGEVERLKTLANPLIFVCKMGTHAGSAIQQLGANVEGVYRLEGGILNYQGQGLHLVKSKAAKNQTRKNAKAKTKK